MLLLRHAQDALAGAGADLGAEDAQEEDEEDDDEEVDETGVSAEDINTLVAQTGCSRSKAVKTLKETGGLVDALIVGFPPLCVVARTQNTTSLADPSYYFLVFLILLLRTLIFCPTSQALSPQ